MTRLPGIQIREVVRPVRLQRSDGDPLSAMIARLMDTMFVIPGTNIRFGFDALIGLFPGAGDAVGALISTVIIAQAARQGVPKVIVARMAGNVFINTVVGAVPILGDVFSVFFKSNAKNYDLLKQHAGRPRSSTLQDWIFVVGLLLTLLACLALCVWGVVMLADFIREGTPR